METANVIPLPERRYRPDVDLVRAALGADHELPDLFLTIEVAVEQLRKRRGEGICTPQACQAVVKALALIYAASGRAIGAEVLS